MWVFNDQQLAWEAALPGDMRQQLEGDRTGLRAAVRIRNWRYNKTFQSKEGGQGLPDDQSWSVPTRKYRCLSSSVRNGGMVV